MRRRMEFRIMHDHEGMNLVDFLVKRFPYQPVEGWLSRVNGGRVSVNGNKASCDHCLLLGEIVSYSAEGLPEPPVDASFDVLFDDADLIVVSKSGNLPCHPGGRYFNNTLWALLKKRFGLDDPSFVNRLDRETSGVVVVARNAEAACKCNAQFARRLVGKAYTVFVEGAFPERLDADGWLVADPASGIRKRRLFVPGGDAGAPAGGEPCGTLFELDAVRGPISVLAARPRTGRQHQIRATLCALGFPVVGDKLYGVDTGVFDRLCKGAMTAEDRLAMRMPRQALHAARLSIRHPSTGEELVFSAPLPADMAGLLEGADASKSSAGPIGG